MTIYADLSRLRDPQVRRYVRLGLPQVSLPSRNADLCERRRPQVRRCVRLGLPSASFPSVSADLSRLRDPQVRRCVRLGLPQVSLPSRNADLCERGRPQVRGYVRQSCFPEQKRPTRNTLLHGCPTAPHLAHIWPARPRTAIAPILSCGFTKQTRHPRRLSRHRTNHQPRTSA